MKRKILIVSASIGTGHTQAARAVEEYWHVMDPDAQVTHVDFLATDTLSLDNLLKETYIKMIDVFPMLYDVVYRLSQGERKGGAVQTILSWILKRRMLKLIKKESPDVVVFTHPFPCGAACILKRQNAIDVPLVGVITDFAVHQFWVYTQVDAYYVGTEGMLEELVKSGVDRTKIHVTGIPVRRRFFEMSHEAHYDKDGGVKVLIMGGGLGLGSFETALQELDQTGLVDQFHVVAGHNVGLYESLSELKQRLKTPTQVYGYTTDIPELMAKSTLLVTKPGALTCMEAVTVGVPMVFFNAIPGQEEANARLLESKGCARWARDINNLADVVTALLINPERLELMRENERAWCVDGAANIGRLIEAEIVKEEHRIAEEHSVTHS